MKKKKNKQTLDRYLRFMLPHSLEVLHIKTTINYTQRF